MVTSIVGSGDGRVVLLAQRSGVVQVVELEESSSGDVVPVVGEEPLVDVTGETTTEGERGLLDMALSDDDRFLTLSYTGLDGALVVASYPLDLEGSVPSTGERRELLRIPHPMIHHIGGGLSALSDGGVLVSVGDMGLTSPPTSQDLSVPYGKVLMIPGPVIRSGTSVDPADLEVVALGLRNPWRISVDRSTGDLWIGDVGEHSFEEIDRVKAAALAAPPDNFGWPAREGGSSGLAGSAPVENALDPILARPHTDDACAIVGGHVYRGERIPVLDGAYLFGDVCSQQIMSIPTSGEPVVSVLVDLPETPISFGQLGSGEIWVAGSTGAVYRLDPAWWDVPDVTDESPTSHEGPTAATTSTTAVASRIDACELLDVLEVLATLETMAEADARQRLDRAVELLESLGSSVPQPLRSQVEVVAAVVGEVRSMGPEIGWDYSNPRYRTYRVAIFEADGPVPEFPSSFAAVLEAIESSCTD